MIETIVLKIFLTALLTSVAALAGMFILAGDGGDNWFKEEYKDNFNFRILKTLSISGIIVAGLAGFAWTVVKIWQM